VYVPPFPSTLDELKNHITTSVKSISIDLLQQVLNEFDYRVDIVSVTKRAYIEHL